MRTHSSSKQRSGRLLLEPDSTMDRAASLHDLDLRGSLFWHVLHSVNQEHDLLRPPAHNHTDSDSHIAQHSGLAQVPGQPSIDMSVIDGLLKEPIYFFAFLPASCTDFLALPAACDASSLRSSNQLPMASNRLPLFSCTQSTLRQAVHSKPAVVAKFE